MTFMGQHLPPRAVVGLWWSALAAGLLLVGATAAVVGFGYPGTRGATAAPATAGSAAGRPGPAGTPRQSATTGLSATPVPSRAATTGTPSPPAVATRPRLLFGIGAEADSAMTDALTRQAPVRMLSSWYNGPGDLSWLSGWRTGTVPTAYRAGYAMHLIVYSGDSEGELSTSYGPACGRAYPLSGGFASDMATLAKIFAGPKTGPPLYVTMFTEFETYPCKDNAWSPDEMTTNYYKALQDQYRAAYAIFHTYAPNARVSLGWGGWQASFDDPSTGGGRSLFPHFADVMARSDFESFQAMDNDTNVADITEMVSVLGRYGPVMLAHYKPDDGSQSTFDSDMHAILTGSYLSTQIHNGLFALSFMDSTDLGPANSLAFVKAAVARYGRSW